MLIADERNELLLSSASSWKIALKFRKGNVHPPNPPDRYMSNRMQAGGIDGFAVLHTHTRLVSHLDDHHRGPFDRPLISQAMLENLPIISAAPAIAPYDVEVIDATL